SNFVSFRWCGSFLPYALHPTLWAQLGSPLRVRDVRRLARPAFLLHSRSESMARQPQEDLFEGTKMTFGEHIEELRIALFQALIGLFIGVVIGFFIASYVVQWIQTPLKSALD